MAERQRGLGRGLSALMGENIEAPTAPNALVGMAAFEDRRLVLDLGGPGLFVSRPMEITVGR